MCRYAFDDMPISDLRAFSRLPFSPSIARVTDADAGPFIWRRFVF